MSDVTISEEEWLRLKRAAGEDEQKPDPTQCLERGHTWKFTGGRACDCEGGGCSFPVHECAVCGECDYGDNEEAAEVRSECQRKREQEGE